MENKARGKLLTIWLVLMLIANILAILICVLLNSVFSTAYPNAPFWASYVLGILGLVNIIFVVFLFRWEKWAFYALCGSAVASFALNIIIGVSTLSNIYGLISPIILYFILRPKWEMFD